MNLVSNSLLDVVKIPAEQNLEDCLTKPLAKNKMRDVRLMWLGRGWLEVRAAGSVGLWTPPYLIANRFAAEKDLFGCCKHDNIYTLMYRGFLFVRMASVLVSASRCSLYFRAW